MTTLIAAEVEYIVGLTIIRRVDTVHVDIAGWCVCQVTFCCTSAASAAPADAQVAFLSVVCIRPAADVSGLVVKSLLAAPSPWQAPA